MPVNCASIPRHITTQSRGFIMRNILPVTTLGLCLLSGIIMAADQELRPVTHEDDWLAKYLQEQ